VQAVCYGWIDSMGRGIDEERYMNRITPQTKKSIWSLCNINKVKEFTEAGLMKPSGLKAFESRDEERTGVYSFEQKDLKFSPEMEKDYAKIRPKYTVHCVRIGTRARHT